MFCEYCTHVSNTHNLILMGKPNIGFAAKAVFHQCQLQGKPVRYCAAQYAFGYTTIKSLCPSAAWLSITPISTAAFLPEPSTS